MQPRGDEVSEGMCPEGTLHAGGRMILAISAVETHGAPLQGAGSWGDGNPRTASAGAELSGAGMRCPVGTGACDRDGHATVGSWVVPSLLGASPGQVETAATGLAIGGGGR